MRVSIALPTDRVEPISEFIAGDAIAEMARAVEAAGFDACFVTDHPIPDDRWLASGGHHTVDPFVALATAAAATKRLLLQTHVLVLAYRNPFLSAKAIASLDVASAGRLIVGVAAGYLEDEFRALGVEFDERNALCDEAIAVMKRAWSESGLALAGRHFEARGNSMLPRPVQQPHPPIWVGGNSRIAIRRAVELGDGWLPFPTGARLAKRVRTAQLSSLAHLERGIAFAREHAAKIGRTKPLDVCFVPFGLDMGSREGVDPLRFLDTASELAALGVTWLTLVLPCESRAHYCESVSRFGEEVLRHLPRES